uniref:YvsA protein n=1 Tax=Bacillus subtilis TaxID=1423 RepID=O52856_BACIU|nr:YvsA protein [Bacillus subtilis] [Bacillus subtilis subsp. subtilis str. 168]
MRFFTKPSLFCADLMASAIWLAIPSTSRLTFKPTSAAVVPAVVVCDIFGAGFSSAEAKDKGAIVKAAPRASVIGIRIRFKLFPPLFSFGYTTGIPCSMYL